VLDFLGRRLAWYGHQCSRPMRGSPLRYLDLMQGRKPHLLVGIPNNLGAETMIETLGRNYSLGSRTKDKNLDQLPR
jgi:hypothetical protein